MYIVISFLLFAIFGSLSLIYNNLFVKTTLVVLLFLCCNMMWFIARDYKGWSFDGNPEQAVLYSINIIEPTPDDKGAIYYWATPLSNDSFLYAPSKGEPRSYFIEYSVDNKKKFQEAKNQLEGGMIVMVGEEVTDKKLPNPDSDNKNKSKGGLSFKTMSPKDLMGK